ncbi:NUDIX hydrolase [Pseudochryseolinea flava]|uniref:DNA mismatch repair protein MutT n=1 Tax=Pseudochryseolinea flava TaxID=2059302 RepID=A0A364Y7B4_9BACT|nr:NUDIX domain-containing protein [Pseudochryseolinea flava]RAW02287.1 DNA mismatch repair protein MutT [Pseudochryseolinea flava]
MAADSYHQTSKIQIAVDCIIFGFDGAALKVLLIKRGFEPEFGKWSLMGGFLMKNETAEDAANRVLHFLTGLKDVYMEQLHTFSALNRDCAARVISIAYFALIDINEYSEQMQRDHEAKWFPIDDVPGLIFDHNLMIAKARDLLRMKVASHPLGFELLPEKFTIPQLRILYESIYATTLDKRNFQKKILSLGILHRLDEKEKESSKKGAFLYVFDHVKYNRLQSGELKFI